MDRVLQWLANGAGLVGILACILAGLMRVSGSYSIHGYEPLTLLIAGIAAMVFSCLVKVHLLGRR